MGACDGIGALSWWDGGGCHIRHRVCTVAGLSIHGPERQAAVHIQNFVSHL